MNRPEETEMRLFVHLGARRPWGSAWYHPANERASAAQRGVLSAMGVKPGVPDIILDLARCQYHGLRIEMKRGGASMTARTTCSKNQRKWAEHFAANGYLWVLCSSALAAAELCERYWLDDRAQLARCLADNAPVMVPAEKLA